MDSILMTACHKYNNTHLYMYTTKYAMQQMATVTKVHAAMKTECNNICGKPAEGLTQWVPIQVDGNTLADGDLVYGSCEEDLYYEIWETNHTCNHSTHTWVLV
jgi:hypothetical protein